MRLTLIDVLLVAAFGFDASFPWWIWGLGIIDAISVSITLDRVVKALERR